MASVSKRIWTSPNGEEKSAWVLRYTDTQGKQRQGTFKLKKQADAARLKIEQEILDGSHVSNASTVIVEKACHEFLCLQQERVSEGAIQPTTYKSMKEAIDLYIIPRLGKRRMFDITPLDVETFYRSIVKANKLAPTTARGRIYVLKCVIDFGIKRGYAKKNPVPGSLKDIGPNRCRRIRTFTRHELTVLMQSVEEKVKWRRDHARNLLRLCVHLAAFCGLRYGEIFALSKESIDFKRSAIKIRQSLRSDDVLKSPKTASGVRDVPMPAHIAGLLREWMELHYRPNDRDLLFRAARYHSHGKITAQHFHLNLWRPLLKRAGLDGGDSLHFHALRHFAASNWIAGGMPVTDAAALMGHSRFDMTLQVYAHPIVNGAERAALIEAVSHDLLPPPRPLPAQGVRMDV